MSRERARAGAGPRAPRRRRTADETRALILEAAARRLAAGGPEALRLQEIARDVGISHPAILHHFGSREGLVGALVARAIGGIEQELRATIERTPRQGGVEVVASLFERLLRTLGAEGHARLLAWLVLSGRAQPGAGGRDRLLRDAARAAQRRRRAGYAAAGRRPPPAEDTLFTFVLGAFALFAEALVGDLVFASAGVAADAAARRRFRVWLARLLEEHLAGEGAAASASRVLR